jgi:hypothetical protein
MSQLHGFACRKSAMSQVAKVNSRHVVLLKSTNPEAFEKWPIRIMQPKTTTRVFSKHDRSWIAFLIDV